MISFALLIVPSMVCWMVSRTPCTTLLDELDYISIILLKEICTISVRFQEEMLAAQVPFRLRSKGRVRGNKLKDV